jgi:hypothetical protein
MGKSKSHVDRLRSAAEVADACPHVGTVALCPHARAIAELHSAPRWLWPSLVSRLVTESWTVEVARREVQKLKEATEPPAWLHHSAIRTASPVSGTSAVPRYTPR